MNVIEVPFGKITKVTVNYRAKSRWGQCCRVGAVDSTYTIDISCDLCHPDAPEKALKETIIHEILHTCPNCMCHTGEWKRLAELVNDCYGYNVKRAGTTEDKGMNDFYREHEEYAKKKSTWKYTIVCKNCGKVVGHKARACKITRHPYLYYHKSCGGNLKVVAS